VTRRPRVRHGGGRQGAGLPFLLDFTDLERTAAFAGWAVGGVAGVGYGLHVARTMSDEESGESTA
jgi:hypothetical protein